MDRRDFLKKAGMAGLGICAAGLVDGCGKLLSSHGGPSYAVPDWTGDNFVPMHRIRDGHAPQAPPPSRKADLVIVGAGISGLTCAYYMKDADFLLLEREPITGGNAKGGDYLGVPYSIGAAYMVVMEKPFTTLYSQLGLNIKPVIHPDDTDFEDGKFVAFDRGKVAKSFVRFRNYLQKLGNGPDFPQTIIQQSSAEALKLDGVSFYDFLSKDYPDLIPAIDAYCYSSLGGGVRNVSAYAGINFYSEIAQDIYAFPGGNSFVAKRLAEEVSKAGANRILTGVSVFRVAQDGDRVLVSYFDNSTLTPVTVECKAAIVSAPYFFASRILAGWPSKEGTFMRSFQYNSYLVANLCFDRRVFSGGYDNWTPGNQVFTDFIPADYASQGNGPPPGTSGPYVLTVYAPFRDAMAGRYALLQGDKEAFAAKILGSIGNFVSFPPGSLKEIRLTRYGHQVLTSRVGLVRGLLGMKKQVGRVILSHSDGQGMAAIESAIAEAVTAVEQVKPLLAWRTPAGA